MTLVVAVAIELTDDDGFGGGDDDDDKNNNDDDEEEEEDGPEPPWRYASFALAGEAIAAAAAANVALPPPQDRGEFVTLAVPQKGQAMAEGMCACMCIHEKSCMCIHKRPMPPWQTQSLEQQDCSS